MKAKKTVLVTGGAGFIGSHVVDTLVNHGFDIKVIDDLSTGKLSNIERHINSGKVSFIKGDIRDDSVIKQVIHGIDVVIHMAALISIPLSFKNPELTYDVNVRGTINLLRLSANIGIDRFVFISSCAVYGDPERLPVTEQTKTSPISPYAISKLLGERYCLGFSQRELLNTAVLRFFNVYGARQVIGDYSGVITKFVNCCKQNKPLTIYGDGSQTRDFVHVSDIANAVVACSEKSGISGETFNIGSGKVTSINELAKTVLSLTGSNLQINYKESRVGDIQSSYADISKATKLLNYKPTISIKEGIQTLLVPNSTG
jgi:UDP-glucose 4-epimerase